MTAVEWLFEQLCSNKLSWNKDINGKLYFDKITSDILQQAKEMEKEQMLNAFQESRLTHPMIGFKHETFVDYYNETFKQK